MVAHPLTLKVPGSLSLSPSLSFLSYCLQVDHKRYRGEGQKGEIMLQNPFYFFVKQAAHRFKYLNHLGDVPKKCMHAFHSKYTRG